MVSRLVVRNSFWQLLVVYVVLVSVAFVGVFSRFTFHFEFFSLLLGVVGFFVLGSRSEGFGWRTSRLLFWFSLLLVVFFRGVPYVGNTIPLGYDAGFYKAALEVDFGSIPSWMITGPTMEPFFLFLVKPFTWVFSSWFILTYLFIGVNVLLALSLFVCCKEFFGRSAALWSLLIFSVSTVQFVSFTFMYYRNILGLSLLLFSVVCLRRCDDNVSYRWLFVLCGAVLGGLHRPTFFLFGLAYVLYAFFGSVSRRGFDFGRFVFHVVNGVLILCLSLLFYLGDFWVAITQMVAPVASSFVNPGNAPGTFISFFSYQFLSLPYLVLALFGLGYVVRERKFDFLFYWFVVNASIVYFQFFFFNRFIIPLDVLLIVFAGLGASVVIRSRPKFGLVLVCLLLFASAALTFQYASDAKPTIGQSDFDLISSLDSRLPADSFLMSFSSDFSPWLVGYTSFDIIAPGLFDEDTWSESEWNAFWSSSDSEVVSGLMSRYDTSRPIFLYTGRFEYANPCFEVFIEENNRRVYEYVC